MRETIILKDVWMTTEEGKGPEGRARWSKIGIGFLNRDGSINVVFDTYRDEHDKQQYKLPTNGRLQIRDRKPTERKGES